MATNPTFSGFLTNFISTNGGSGDFTDILSNLAKGTDAVVTYNTDTVVTDNNGTNITIEWKYFYLGNLLIQFTHGGITDNLTGGNPYTLNYGKAYPSSAPYFISLTSTDTDNGTGSVTLNSKTSTHFKFSTSGGVSLTALVIGPST